MVGGPEDFNALVEKHYQALKYFLWSKTKNREHAEDLTHETIIKAQINFSQLRDFNKFQSWLFAIGFNLFLNDLRNKKAETIEGLQLVCEVDYENEIAKNLAKEKLIEFARALPFRQREAFSRRVFGGESFKEIAVEMDCPYDTAKANFLHASQKFFRRK